MNDLKEVNKVVGWVKWEDVVVQATKVPTYASLPSHSHYMTCTSWVIFFHSSMVNTDVKIKIMKIARHVILKVCKPTQRKVVKASILLLS